MSKIQDDNKLYSIVKAIADYHTRKGYRRFHVTGRHNIPKDGACIYGANHSNALMDAMVLLATDPPKKVFIARGDIFKKPVIANILTWMRILPIFRIRDGLNTVRDKNSAIIDKAVDVIHDEVPLYIFPEATHRTKHSLRQLSKGIFHIALNANRQFGNEKPVYIVPIGIEYGDYFRYRSTVLVSFGKPINVTDYVKAHPDEQEAVVINNLRDLLRERMAELISYVPDDEDYEAIWEITKIKAGTPPLSLLKRRDRNKKFIKQVTTFREKQPEKAKVLFEKVKEFTKHRIEHSISVTSVAKNKPFFGTLWKTLMLIVKLPFFLVAAVATLPIWATASFILKNLKDKAFRNTVNYCTDLILHPLLMCVGIPLFFSLMPWEYAALSSIYLYYSYIIFFDYCDYFRRWMSDVRWTFNGKLRKEFNELKLNTKRPW